MSDQRNDYRNDRHLPDCDDYAFSGAGFHPNCERICICRQVRRIEQRVRMEDDDYAYVAAQAEADGRRRALAAARDAVAAVPPIDQRVDDNGLVSLVYDKGEALAAIDALREKP